MTFAELERYLLANGFELKSINGATRKYSNPASGKATMLHFHPSKEVPKGTMHAILKAAGLKGKK
ncbi:addiction module toxin, HicA family [bacterium]|nr:addiction module toxin, HicA family [bacterium]